MPLLGGTLIFSARRARLHAENMLHDVAPDLFSRKPRGEGGRVIETNHPAFLYGHLALYPHRLLTWLGEDPQPVVMPAPWAQLFGPGAKCHDDPDHALYPPMDEIVAAFRRAYDAVYEILPNVPDERFLVELPEERFRKFLPTVGVAVISMLTSHMAFHMGQVSAWRRCMGLGPAE